MRQLSQLRGLYISSNQLRALPAELASCRDLEEVERYKMWR